MKILQISNVHLDNPNVSKERREEIRDRFIKVITDGINEGVNAVLICGGLCDAYKLAQATKDALIDLFRNNPNVNFYYLRKKDERNDLLSNIFDVPKNLYMFGDILTSYELSEGIVINGIEISDDELLNLYDDINIPKAKFNIMMLSNENTDPEKLKGKGIRYIAYSGNEFDMKRVDGKSFYVKTGVIEPIDYTEDKKCGSVIINIDMSTGKISHDLNDEHLRHAFNLDLDITECLNALDVLNKLKTLLEEKKVTYDDIVHINLIGSLYFDTKKGTKDIDDTFKQIYYSFDIEDNTSVLVDYDKYEKDESLRGEFFRLLFQDTSLDENDKAYIIKYGMKALGRENLANED